MKVQIVAGNLFSCNYVQLHNFPEPGSSIYQNIRKTSEFWGFIWSYLLSSKMLKVCLHVTATNLLPSFYLISCINGFIECPKCKEKQTTCLEAVFTHAYRDAFGEVSSCSLLKGMKYSTRSVCPTWHKIVTD